jgi:hypothetical protein
MTPFPAYAQSAPPSKAAAQKPNNIVATPPLPTSPSSTPSPAPKYVEGKDFALWNKYEDVAIHFNTLIMQLRTQALAAVAGVVTIAGLAISFAGKSARATEWHILFGTILFLTLAWIALAILDIFYYDELLKGAVTALLEHEAATSVLDNAGNPMKDKSGKNIPAIILSTRINQAVPPTLYPIWSFYGLVLAGLLFGLGYTGFQFFRSPGGDAGGKLECKIDRAPSEKLQITVEPTAVAAAPPGPA